MSRSFRLGIFPADDVRWRPAREVWVRLLEWVCRRFPTAEFEANLWRPRDSGSDVEALSLERIGRTIEALPERRIAEDGLSLSVWLRGDRTGDHTLCDLIDPRGHFCVRSIGMDLESSVRDTWDGLAIGAEATCPECGQAVRFSVEDFEEESAGRGLTCAACGRDSTEEQYGYVGPPGSVFEIRLNSLLAYDPPGLAPRLRQTDLREIDRITGRRLGQAFYYQR